MKLYDEQPMIDRRQGQTIFYYFNTHNLTLGGQVNGTKGIIDNYSSYIWTERLFKPGDFEIILKDNNPLEVGALVFRKETDRIGIVESIENAIDENGDKQYIIKGRFAEQILANRLTGRQMRVTGVQGEAIYKLLKRVFHGVDRGTGNTPNGRTLKDNEAYDIYVRGIPENAETQSFNNPFSLAIEKNGELGANSNSYQFTGDNLLTAIQQIGASEGVVVELSSDNIHTYTGQGALNLKARVKKGVTTDILTVRDDFITNCNYIYDITDKATACLVAFNGEGASRNMIWVDLNTNSFLITGSPHTVDDAPAYKLDNTQANIISGLFSFGLSRKEVFIDKRDVALPNLDYSNDDNMQKAYNIAKQIALQELNVGIKALSFEFDTRSFKYRKDYKVGQRVTLQTNIFDNDINVYVVTEAIESVDENGDYKIVPTLEIEGVYTFD